MSLRAGTTVSGLITVSNGEIVYTPTNNYDGETIISYTASDGTLSDTGFITVSVTGVDDPAIITGMTTGIAVEDGSAITGDLDHTDVDSNNADDLWQVVSTPTASTNAYGTYTIDASGLWTYTVDNNNATVNVLYDGETLLDSFTVLTEDGTSQVVTITINGSSDAPVAADNQSLLGIEETVLTVTPMTSDAEGDTLTITVDSVTEAGGVVTGVNNSRC